MINVYTIKNSGQKIAATNYFRSPAAKEGKIYLSWNAGAARLLVPDDKVFYIKEMKKAKLCIISKGPLEGGMGFELLFEDYTDTAFSHTIDFKMTDRYLPSNDEGKEFIVAVWTRKGLSFEVPGKYREVPSLPDLSPWVE